MNDTRIRTTRPENFGPPRPLRSGGSFFALAWPERVTRELGLPLTVRAARAVRMSPMSASFLWADVTRTTNTETFAVRRLKPRCRRKSLIERETRLPPATPASFYGQGATKMGCGPDSTPLAVTKQTKTAAFIGERVHDSGRSRPYPPFNKHDVTHSRSLAYLTIDEGEKFTAPRELVSLLQQNLGSIPPAITKSVEAVALPV